MSNKLGGLIANALASSIGPKMPYPSGGLSPGKMGGGKFCPTCGAQMGSGMGGTTTQAMSPGLKTSGGNAAGSPPWLNRGQGPPITGSPFRFGKRGG